MRRGRAVAARATCRWLICRRPRSRGERQVAEIEDVLPLTPLQEGLLFHALYDAAAPDVYTVQLDLELTGALDADRLMAAVQALVARHASLRACFRHDGLRAPVQVIVPRASVPWRRIDLSMLPEAEREQRLAALLRQDRLERFDLRPGSAAAVCADRGLRRIGTCLVLSSHHLLMDGWSGAGAGARAAVRCTAQGDGDGTALPRAVPYRDYLAFIAGQDRSGVWRRTGARRWPGFRRAPACAGCGSEPCGGCAGAAFAFAWGGAERGVERAGARLGGDAEHACCRRCGACCWGG